MKHELIKHHSTTMSSSQKLAKGKKPYGDFETGSEMVFPVGSVR